MGGLQRSLRTAKIPDPLLSGTASVVMALRGTVSAFPKVAIFPLSAGLKPK
jgi:hypothetical protein